MSSQPGSASNPKILTPISTTALAATARAEAKNFSLLILRDPTYRANLLKRAQAGTLAPAVEIALMHYGWGKPTERIEIGQPGSFTDAEGLSSRQLGDRVRQLAEIIEAGGNPDDPLPSPEELAAQYDEAREAALQVRLKHIDYEERKAAGLNGNGNGHASGSGE